MSSIEDMDTAEDTQEFRGFKMNDVGPEGSDGELSDESKDETKDESKDSSLPNGTEDENAEIKDDLDEKLEEKDDDEDEEDTRASSEPQPEVENEPKEKLQGSGEPARKRLRSTSSGALSEKGSLNEKDDEDEGPEGDGDDEGFSSSDGEDFLGFDMPDNNEKEEFIRSLLDEHESLDSSDSGTPAVKSQSRSRRSDRSAWKKTVNVNLSNPEYKKPFEFGWVRELVYRSTSDTALRRNADIYYFTPKGKKVRSFREVAEHLTADLTIDNFTFFKGPIGIGDPDKEIIREAKVKPSFRLSEDGFGSSPVRKLTPKLKATATPKTSTKGSPPENSKSSLTPRVVFKGNQTPKNKTSVKTKLGIKDKKRRSAGPDDLEMGMLPPTAWSPEPKVKTNGVERRSYSPSEASSPPPEKKQKLKDLSGSGSYPVTQNFMMNLNAGFLALLHAFQYLKVHELLRASCVSHMWKHIASHRSLWETVHMKNSRVRDWEGFGRALSTSGTRNLDLKKMLLPDAQEAIVEMWNELSKAVAEVSTLRRIDFGRCIPEAIENVAKVCPQLESITSLSIRGSHLDVKPLADCTRLVEVRLKSLGGIELKNLSSLKCLMELRHLSLTTVKSLTGIEHILGEKLESLELGECSSLSEVMATEALPKLINLKRMRLEKGQGPACPTSSLLTTVSTLPNLIQLELINFDVKPGFDKALAKCTNLRTLLIIPTYVTQSATTNHVVMGGVSKLSGSLSYFVWGLTLELLRVTDLFIDQVEGHKGKMLQQNQPNAQPQQPQPPKKGAGDSIPILKPIVEEGVEGGTKEGQTASQVDILALPKLQKVLSTLLPTTKIKILKVPFSATWRQTISESPPP